MSALHETIAKAVPQIERGKVWCVFCGRMLRVDGADALRHGWPKCCGSTMTIDSPQWRVAHRKAEPSEGLRSEPLGPNGKDVS